MARAVHVAAASFGRVSLAACAAGPKTKTAASEAVTPAGEVEMEPVSSGYANVNGIKPFHEVYGEGFP